MKNRSIKTRRPWAFAVRALLTVLTCALLLAVLAAVPAAAQAEDVAYPVSGGNIYFDKATGTVTSCDGTVTAANIPAKINNVAVTAIGNRAFLLCTNLTGVTIPNGVTRIGSAAFTSCTSLTSVTIPNSVTYITTGAFSNCSKLKEINVGAGNTNYSSLNGVLFNKAQTELLCYPGGKQGVYTVPDSVTGIGDYAFDSCPSLTCVIIPDSVTRIGEFAFYGCAGLTSLAMGYSVATIGQGAFQKCDSLKDVYYNGNEAQWRAISVNTAECGNDPLLGATIHYSGSQDSGVVAYPVSGGNIYFDKATGMITGSDYDVTAANIPASIDGVAVTGIEETAFGWHDNLTSVTIPDSVTRIGDMAFYYCEKLASVTIGRGVYLIGEEAFACCHSLTGVTIPANVLKIGHWAFTYCENLKEIKVVEGNSAYSSQDGVLFNKDKTELIHYPGSKEGYYTVPGSVTAIGESAFCECAGLTGVTLPSGVTKIEENAFERCINLASVTIPAHVKNISEYAFFGCESLKNVYYGGSPAQWQAINIDYANHGNDYLLSAEKHYYSGSSFSDMKPNDWFVTSVNYAVANGLMQGVGNNKFAPNATLSRAMLVTILYRIEGEPAVSGANPFSDVAQGSWYDAPVQWASSNGIVSGMGNNKFAPNDNITREQFAAILYRYAQFKGGDVNNRANLAGYSDYSSISGWAMTAMSWANAEGLIQGRTAATLAPQGTATRAEAAAILMRYLEKPSAQSK